VIPWGGPVKGGPHGVTRYSSRKRIFYVRPGREAAKNFFAYSFVETCRYILC